MKTIGEKRVRVDYNKPESTTKYSVQKTTAELIDHLEAVKNDEVSKTYKDSPEQLQVTSGEKLRLIAMAQTAFETAADLAVKAITAE